MMMGMLQAGGLELLVDDVRAADAGNPRGYFEYEPVKSLRRESPAPWLSPAAGKGLKVISRLLFELPSDYQYNVIFMQRPIAEVLASQRQMMRSMGQAVDEAEDVRLGRVFAEHLVEVEAWMSVAGHLRWLDCSYSEVVSQPFEQSVRVTTFLGLELDAERMAASVDPNLYRQRLCKGAE